MRKRRIVNVKIIPGDPLDGTGRVCIHLFVEDKRGMIVEPHVLHPVVKDREVVKQQLEAKPTRGRLACDSRKLVAPVTRNGVTTVTSRTTDARVVTCPKCQISEDYIKAIEILTPAGVE